MHLLSYSLLRAGSDFSSFIKYMLLLITLFWKTHLEEKGEIKGFIVCFQAPVSARNYCCLFHNRV